MKARREMKGKGVERKVSKKRGEEVMEGEVKR